MRATAFAQNDLGREIAKAAPRQYALRQGEQFLFFGGRGDAGHGSVSAGGFEEG
jgi:hypothetical protein